MNPYVPWFRRLVWLGILVNFAFAFLCLLWPQALFDVFGLEQATPTIWTRDAGLFLIFVSLFYVPAARDPFRYRFYAYLLVIARLGYVVFWLACVWLLPDVGPEYLKFGIGDLLIGVPQAILLWLMFRAGDQRATAAAASEARASR